MFKRFDICIILFLLLNASYWLIFSAINSCVSPYVYFLLPAIFVVPCAMFLGTVSMAIVVVISAFMFALPSQSSSFIVCVAWCAIGFLVNTWRFKFRTLDWFSCIMLMQIVNTALLVFYAIVLPNNSASFFDFVRRFSFDFAVSGLSLCLCGNFCVALPVSIMSFFGVDITTSEDV